MREGLPHIVLPGFNEKEKSGQNQLEGIPKSLSRIEGHTGREF